MDFLREEDRNKIDSFEFTKFSQVFEAIIERDNAISLENGNQLKFCEKNKQFVVSGSGYEGADAFACPIQGCKLPANSCKEALANFLDTYHQIRSSTLDNVPTERHEATNTMARIVYDVLFEKTKSGDKSLAATTDEALKIASSSPSDKNYFEDAEKRFFLFVMPEFKRNIGVRVTSTKPNYTFFLCQNFFCNTCELVQCKTTMSPSDGIPKKKIMKDEKLNLSYPIMYCNKCCPAIETGKNYRQDSKHLVQDALRRVAEYVINDERPLLRNHHHWFRVMSFLKANKQVVDFFGQTVELGICKRGRFYYQFENRKRHVCLFPLCFGPNAKSAAGMGWESLYCKVHCTYKMVKDNGIKFYPETF